MNIHPATEEWRQIPSWPEYEVSSTARVRRVTRAHGAKVGRILTPWISVGYRYVGLWRENRVTRIAVHRLVASAFLPAPGRGQRQIAHCDGDPLNNAPANLRWATPTENMRDRHQHGTDFTGENNPHARLTVPQVEAIRSQCDAGRAHRQVAAMFGVCRQTISDIASGRRWKILSEKRA